MPSTYSDTTSRRSEIGDHERVGLLGDALGRAVARAGLYREDRRVGRQLDVGVRDLGRVGAEHDRAVHLRELVQDRRRVVEIELDPAREQEPELVGVTDHDQAAGVGMQDVVDALAQRRARGHHLQRPDDPGLLSRLELLFELFPGTRRHEGRF